MYDHPRNVGQKSFSCTRSDRDTRGCPLGLSLRQPHPVGSVQYYYLVVFPNLITLLGVIAIVFVIVSFARRRRDL